MPKNKVRKHLQFYLDHIYSREMYWWGLCSCALDGNIDKELLELFKPHLHEKPLNVAYWGSGTRGENRGKFTPMRQTIVLFMAAINGEL